MTDEDIISLYLIRSEQAIIETDIKYGGYCKAIAYSILKNNEDTKECVNDAYLNLWNSIPPNVPDSFCIYLGRITRNIAINRYNYYSAKKRNGIRNEPPLNESMYYCNGGDCTNDIDSSIMIGEILDGFMNTLRKLDREIFTNRYWNFNSIKEIADACSVSDSFVKVSLYRSRSALRKILEREGFL